ncbi:MAG: hypothetical protein LH615_06015 [Ferruginibacter sp.]|nr:hypothetical protein [Ferruginibacter sp.]
MRKYICAISVVCFLGNLLFAQKVFTTADYPHQRRNDAMQQCIVFCAVSYKIAC